MRIHVLQVGYGDEEPFGARVDRVSALVAQQTGADLVVLPELWAAGGFAYRGWADTAEAVPGGPVVSAISAAARAAGCAVHAGSVIERDASGHLWNTSVLLDATGAVTATYRKMHRFGFGEGEPRLLAAGTDLVIAEVPTSARVPDPHPGPRPGPRPGPGPGPDHSHDPLTVGLATCYDLRFPELFRALLDAGATAFVVPAAWPAARVEHWTLLGRARAVENQCVLIAANTAGTHSRHTMGGRSQVVGPMGEVLGEAGDEEEILVVDLDPAGIAAARAAFPVLADRRLRPTLQG